jgi:hypothetical protein
MNRIAITSAALALALGFGGAAFATDKGTCGDVVGSSSKPCNFVEFDKVEVDVDLELNGQLVKKSNVIATATLDRVTVGPFDPKVNATAVGNNFAGENVEVNVEVPQAVIFSDVIATATVSNSVINEATFVDATAVANNLSVDGDKLTGVGQLTLGTNVIATASLLNTRITRGEVGVDATAVGNNISVKNLTVRD